MARKTRDGMLPSCGLHLRLAAVVSTASCLPKRLSSFVHVSVHPRESPMPLPPSILILFLIYGAGGELTLDICRLVFARTVSPLKVWSINNPLVDQLYRWSLRFAAFKKAFCAVCPLAVPVDCITHLTRVVSPPLSTCSVHCFPVRPQIDG